MIRRICKLFFFGIIVAWAISACTDRPALEQSKMTTGANENMTNFIATMPSEARQYLNTNAQARHYFEQFMPEITRNEKVSAAIKNAIATNRDDRVLAFHEFLSHWHLRWPVAKKGAFGEGGIGFGWNKDLNAFQGGVDATAIIQERYTLQIILDCDISKDYKTVEFTNLRFSFGEVEDVQVSPGGGADVRYNINNGEWFGLKEWEQLKAANWDFSKIGINIISNAPIPHIREAFN